ncbi:MAG: Hpt domain-containing protein [Sulfuricurvum sp.]|nr:Hpt domain-containing protein [Sulfuricurvum sp.]
MSGEVQQIQEFEEVLSKLKEMLHLTDEIMIKLYATFFETVAVTLQMLKDAIEAEDYDAIKLHAHSIKGSSSSLCYNAISKIAEMIEKKAELKESYVYEDAFKELVSQFDIAQHNYVLWTRKRG